MELNSQNKLIPIKLKEALKITTTSKHENVGHIAARMNKSFLLNHLKQDIDLTAFNYRGYQALDYVLESEPVTGKICQKDNEQDLLKSKLKRNKDKYRLDDLNIYYDYCLLFTVCDDESIQQSPVFKRIE
jgi:hypothetical protein